MAEKKKYNCSYCGPYEADDSWPACPECLTCPPGWIAKNTEKSPLSCGIPPRHESCRLANFQTENGGQKKALAMATRFCDKFPQLIKTGIGGLIFYGTVGTGKTHLACAMLTELYNRYNASVRYTNVFDYIKELRATWTRPDKSEAEVVNRYAGYDLLVIDEIGVQYGTKSEQVQLFQLINQRSMNMKPTILISNLDEEELIQTVGEAIVDRIFENKGALVAFNWESKRR